MIRLLDQPHTVARRLVSSGAPVFVPMNPVEYHGPHLSLHNDALCSAALANALHGRLSKTHDWPMLIASDLEIGVEPAPGPGSRWISHRAARSVAKEACRALIELGATRIIFATFHGAPLHNLAIDGAVQWANRNGARAVSVFDTVLNAQLTLDPEPFRSTVQGLPQADADKMLADMRWDFHAGFMETSMALWAAPDSVDPSFVTLPDCPPIRPAQPFASLSALAARLGRHRLAAELLFAAYGVGWTALRPFPGYTGRPSLATPEAGAVFANAMLDEFERVCEDVFVADRPAPRPIMSWLATITLGGLIPGPTPPGPNEVGLPTSP